MNAALSVAGLLLLVGALPAALAYWRSRRLGSASALLPVPLALLLYLGLFPPPTSLRTDRLSVLTPGVTADQLRELPRTGDWVALPGAVAPPRAEPVPDLATALRQRPEVGRLLILGHGLPPRDLPAAAGLATRLRPAPVSGIHELRAELRGLVGWRWAVRGQAAPAGARLELRDPANTVVDEATAGADGAFTLSAPLRAAGEVRFELQARAPNDDANLLDRLSLPVRIEPGHRLRVRVLAGAPQAELKYLRRWADAAGLATAWHLGLAPGIAMTQGTATDHGAGQDLSALDLLVLDERSWDGLAPDTQAAVRSAVERGMGLLLRVSAPPSDTVVAQWSTLGFRLTPLSPAPRTTLDRALANRRRDAFQLAPVNLDPAGLQVLLADDEGAPVVAWRRLGRGRIGLTRLTDSFRLVLAGQTARHGSLWAGIFGTLARPRTSEPDAELSTGHWLHERQVVCGLPPAAELREPGGARLPLLTTDTGCAAFWPRRTGWHWIEQDPPRGFYVYAADEARGLRAARDRRATAALPATAATDPRASTSDRALPRLPFLLAFILLAALLWWRERRQA